MLKYWHTADAAASHISWLMTPGCCNGDVNGEPFMVSEVLGLSDQMGHELPESLRAAAEAFADSDERDVNDPPPGLEAEKNWQFGLASPTWIQVCEPGCEHNVETDRCLIATLVDVAESHGELFRRGFLVFAEEEVEEVIDDLKRRFRPQLLASRVEIEGLPEQIPVFKAVQELLATL